MHYLTHVFIPTQTNIEDAVAEALRPFGDEFEVKPWKRYLDAGEIAAMADFYHTRRTALRKLSEHMEDWNGGTGGVDAQGLFAMLTYNPDAQWDWYEIGGRFDGVLPRNVLSARALLGSPKLKERLPHDFLTPDGTWHQVERFVGASFLGGHFERTSEKAWLEEFIRALETYADYRVVCVDRHS